MAPDVIVVPHVIVPPDKNPGELYRRMREIAVEYARRMDWGWEEVRKRQDAVTGCQPAGKDEHDESDTSPGTDGAGDRLPRG